MRISRAGRSIERGRNAGFTLIEISVVVLLVGLFTLLAIPRFNLQGSAQLDKAAKRLGNTSRYLLNEASLSGLEHRLIYNLDEGSYRALVVRQDGEMTAAGIAGKGARLSDGVRIRDLVLPGHGTFTSGEITTRIFPSGWLEETIVHLENRQGEQLTVRLAPLSGVAEIYAGYRDFR